ncbi:hypothetical protein GMORB2_1588 [Geosmithia morbida]|uniref:Uncharacterized protein n=1 Tax=Geosmithia morbida TaxID=1094350 RepID=A0A9P4YU00_9HYPO|nr:uncharacterized protein GMORB2_1588 [Geosmithia morbida]KAF4121749.1 hypothetical protein GMORB2_1588 [Geosmithia morbida]
MASLFKDAPCTDPPSSTPSDAGVAGAGILISFIIAAAVALVLSMSLIFSESRGKTSTVRRKLLDGYSDSQLLQGIGIQSVGLAKTNTLVPYHIFLIWMMSLLATATHNATLLALVHDYRRDWVIRWLRQSLMFVNLALSCVLGVFVLQAVSRGLDDETLPIACVWNSETHGGSRSSTVGLSYVGTVIVIIGNCVVFGLATWYLHARQRRFHNAVQLVGIILMAAIAIGAAVRIVLLSQAFGHPSVKLTDQGEKEWSFGQLLSVLLLILPLVSIVDIYRGEVKLADPVECDREPIDDGDEVKA